MTCNNAKTQNSESYYSLFHLFSEKIFEYLLSGSRWFRYWGYKRQSSPALLDTLVTLLPCMTITVAKWEYHSIWALHLFSLLPSNWSIMMDTGPRGEWDKLVCTMSPDALSSHLSYILIHSCLILILSTYHQFYQQCSWGWHTQGLLSLWSVAENVLIHSLWQGER